jgi:DNA-binding transcriptional MerR regulator
VSEITDVTGWRIDELARRSGESVDTIRFYQREGLLEPPRRAGRTALYGPGHLRRLEQVRTLQTRHLSLAAIRSLLSHSRVALAETLFATGAGDYTRAQLAEVSKLPLDLVQELEDVGLLITPARLGRESYDDADARLLATVRQLLALGLTRPFVVRLAGIYADGFATMHEQVLRLFTEPTADTAEDLPEVQELLAGRVREVLPMVEAILDHTHQRTVQRLTVDGLAYEEATEAAEAEGIATD